MSHIGIMCPNTSGHLNPMIALADALRTRGHRVTFFLLGDPSASVKTAGFQIVLLGGSVFPPDQYRAGLQRLGSLQGQAALKQTFAMGARAAEAILKVGPTAARAAGITALLVDQASFPGGTVADELGIPFATVCNALLLHSEPTVPPFFTHWQPQDSWLSRTRTRVAWAGLNRLYAPILTRIQERRRQLGLPIPTQIAATWSDRIQISQQPEAFEFPRQELPNQLRFVGPLRLPNGYQPVPFPWDRLDSRPLIYASLGTLQNRVEGTFRTIVDACEGLETQLVISTGHGVAPEKLGELPGHPIIVPYAPQLDLLSRSALAVTHAGLNTVLDSLSTGVPMVTIPITNEQPGIAARVAWAGAGENIIPKQLTPERLRAAVVRVRSDSSYRTAAEQIRESIKAGGGAPRAAAMIEQSLELTL